MLSTATAIQFQPHSRNAALRLNPKFSAGCQAQVIGVPNPALGGTGG
jgi:hypothetical protein